MNATEYRTDDLAFAAFLKVKGYGLTKVEKLNPTERKSKRIFFFKMPEKEIDGLMLEFVNSDFLKFYNEILGLKKL